MSTLHIIPNLLLAVIPLLCGGCVHEFPAVHDESPVMLNLLLIPETTWETQDFDPSSRSGDSAFTEDAAGWQSRYVVKVFGKGSRKNPVEEFVCYSAGDEESYLLPLTLNPGDWDIYVWRDYCHPSLSFHNADRFEAICYEGEDYHGAHEMRDAHEGMLSVSTRDFAEAENVTITMAMQRPVARYVFIATDYRKFCEMNRDSFGGYKGEGVYPLFMPSVYNIFSKQIVDSDTGRSYLCDITPVSEDEAVVAFDHVLMNDRDNAAQVQLLLHDPGGGVRAVTSVLTVPLRRGVTTYVRGDFLTVKGGGGGGIKIDTSFGGEFNIQL